MQRKRLSQLDIGDIAVVEEVNHVGVMERRLFELGLVPNSEVTCVIKAANNGMKGLLICGAVIALRQEDSEKVIVICTNF